MKRSFPSKIVQRYVKETKKEYLDQKETFLKMLEGKETPYRIGLHFVRKTKRRWDFHNMCQLVLDLMTTYEWIEDDNTNIIFPFPLEIEDKLCSYNKEKPGVYITLL